MNRPRECESSLISVFDRAEACLLKEAAQVMEKALADFTGLKKADI